MWACVAAGGQRRVVRHQHEGGAALARQLQHQLEHRVAVSRSRLPVGSSASTQAGRVTRARAIATRWRSPPDSCDGWCCHARRQAHALPAWPRRGARVLGHALAADAQRHGHVVERAELRQQVVELVDEAQVLVAPAALLGGAHRREVAAHQLDAAGVGASSPPSRCSSVLLPEPEAPTTASVSPAPHLQVDAAQHGARPARRAAAFAEALVQVLGLQHGRLTHNAAPRPG
jgi:hypothetical protein